MRFNSCLWFHCRISSAWKRNKILGVMDLHHTSSIFQRPRCHHKNWEARRNLHLDCFMETSCSCLLGPSVVASSAHVCVRRVRDWRRSSRTAIPATYLMCCCKSKPCCFGLPDLQLHGIVQPSSSHTAGWSMYLLQFLWQLIDRLACSLPAGHKAFAWLRHTPVSWADQFRALSASSKQVNRFSFRFSLLNQTKAISAHTAVQDQGAAQLAWHFSLNDSCNTRLLR